jgi:hypothetical protein
MQHSKRSAMPIQEEATLVPNNHSNSLLFSPTTKHSRIQSNFDQTHIKPKTCYDMPVYFTAVV